MSVTLESLGLQLGDDEADAVALQRDVATALGDADLRVPAFCLVGEHILRHRIEGESEDDIAAWLVGRVGISPDRTAQILEMTTDAGHAAADIGDGADFDERVDRMAASTLAERPFVAAMVRMAGELLHSETARLDRVDLVAGLLARFDIDEATIEAVMQIVRGLLLRHAAGATDQAERLAADTGMQLAAATSFVEQARLARDAAVRVRRGEDMAVVFHELGLERAAPQFVIVALRLVDERGLAVAADG